MSDKNKIIFVGIGLAVIATTVAALGFSLTKENPPETTIKNRDRPAVKIDTTAYERKGKITFISIEGTNIGISSEEGDFSFFVSESSIIGQNEDVLSARDLVIGMEIEATVKRGEASSIRIKSTPPLAVVSPPHGSIASLDFYIKGKTFIKGETICLNLLNRRTGAIYENQLSAPINKDKNFSIPISLSTALDATAGDILDASLSVCGSDKIITAEWIYNPGNTSRIKVYFLKDSCNNFYVAERVILASRSLTRTALDELLKGPNAKEALDGIFSSTNPKERVQDIKTESSVVYFDFSPTVVNTERCDIATLKSQITKTLNQFPIEKFILTIEGKKENPLN